ncbi:Ig-like domain-containing protein [Xylanibacter rodentium]|uniref:Ig-like domain-containing protein n=2 Tax=Xylanibacter rodentium TaxID=2736289 RepID=UPI00155668D9|nr:Ig-like domain-containing protein [Xylanibacter rodentium]NPE11393.1 hypothetical protein [Prevotella sp. PJ1A]NPE38844.1 hypothetical protein [Prevotella sp. PCJ2]
MKKNFFLTMGLLFGSAALAQAQTVLLSEGFESEMTKQPTELGFYEFINTQEGDERNLTNEKQWSGDQSLHFYNDAAFECKTETWQRAIKFRNLPLKENTPYRVSFYLTGTNQYTLDGETYEKTKARVALMQGEENADLPLLTADSTQITYDLSYFQEDDKGFRKYTMMFFYANQAIQQEYYKNHPGNASNELAQKFFLTLNVFNPGDFWIDDVKIEEGAEIEGITFNGDVLKVNFGYKVNVASLVPEGKERLLLPADCVTVGLKDGKQYGILSVEAWKDGSLYIFLDGDDYPDETEADNVVVTFKNPADEACRIKYTESLRPYSFDEDTSVKDFTENGATYDDNIQEVYSYAYKIPTLVGAVPEDGSFDLPLTTNEFTLSFDKNVNTEKVSAALVNANGKEEELTVATTGMAEVLKLTRTGAEELVAGEYKLTITGVEPEVDPYDNPGEYSITLNFGMSSSDPNDVVKVLWTDSFSVVGANKIPAGWTLKAETNDLVGPMDAGSGPRVFDGFSGDFTHALYYRMGYAVYGGNADDEVHRLALEEGKKYQVSFNAVAWKAAPFGRFEVLDEADATVASYDFQNVTNPAGEGAKGNITVGAHSMTFTAPANGNYKLRWSTLDKEGGEISYGGWLETLLGNVKVQYIPNNAGAAYKQALAEALATAKNALANNSGARFAGVAYDALDAAIKKYDGQAYTAPSAYDAAVAELNAATLALSNHRTLCDTYDPMPALAWEQVKKFADSKFNGTDYYKALETTMNKYVLETSIDEIDLITEKVSKIDTLMTDAELEAAIAELDKNTAIVKNMCTTLAVDEATGLHKRSEVGTTGVAALTARLVKGADALTRLNTLTGKEEFTDYIEKANNALTDDDALAEELKYLVWTKINTTLADPENTLFADRVDEVTMDNYKDSIDMTVFVKNPNFYITTPTNTDVTNESANGWNVKYLAGWSGGFAWSTGWSWLVTDKCPVADGMLTNYNCSFTATQEVTGLPHGYYNIKFAYGERENYNPSTQKDTLSYAYIKVGEDSIAKGTRVIGQIFPYCESASQTVFFEKVKITDGKVLLGIYGDTETHMFLNEVVITMVDEDTEFNYATGIKDIENQTVAQPVKTEYFDLNGRKRTNALNGLTIMKQTFGDGTVKVKKVLK